MRHLYLDCDGVPADFDGAFLDSLGPAPFTRAAFQAERGVR